MSLTFREECKASLQTQSWRVLSVQVGAGSTRKDYLVKSLFEERCYHVMLSDSSAIWEEKIDGDAITQRLKV